VSSGPTAATEAPASARWVAAALVAGTLLVAGTALWGDANPDWQGYEDVFAGEGAWLAAQGRDPLFTSIVQGAYALLGDGGYEQFRSLLLAYFIAVAALIAHRLVQGPSPGVLDAAVVALAVVAIVVTKFTVQVREGLALTALVGAFWRERRADDGEGAGRVATFLLFLAAGMVHAGMLLYLAAWAVAWLLARLLPASIRSGAFDRVLLALAVLVGFAVVRSLSAFDSLFEALDLLGISAEAEAEGSLAKYGYWMVMGTMVLALRSALTESARGEPAPGVQAFVRIHASLIMPAAYFASLFMVLGGTPAAFTSLGIRTLQTAIGMAMLVLLLRGQPGWPVAASSVVMLLDQARTVRTALGDT
jgi:hypothetical protein